MRIKLAEILPFNSQDINEDEIFKVFESVRDKGLINPVTVRLVDGKYQLMAGRKRVLAHKRLDLDDIEVTVREADDTEAFEVTIHENLKRSNLQWYEEADLTQQLHEFRQKQHGGQDRRGRPKSGETIWGVRDTAEELGRALGQVSESLALARAVRNDPSLKNIKDRNTAIRLVRQAAKRVHTEEEQRLPASMSPDEIRDQIYLGSSIDVLRHLPSNSFHACITDPPWLKFRDDRLTADDETLPVFHEVYRVLKPDSYLYMFVGLDDLILYRKELKKLNFQVAKTPLIWHKKVFLTRHGVAAWEYDRDFEFIILAVKGNPSRVHAVQRSAIFTYDAVHPSKTIHPNEKPVPLIEKILDHCTYDGANVLDPFAGSGAILEAVYRTGRNYVGVERDPTFYQNIVKRMEKLRAEEQQAAGSGSN